MRGTGPRAWKPPQRGADRREIAGELDGRHAIGSASSFDSLGVADRRNGAPTGGRAAKSRACSTERQTGMRRLDV